MISLGGCYTENMMDKLIIQRQKFIEFTFAKGGPRFPIANALCSNLAPLKETL